MNDLKLCADTRLHPRTHSSWPDCARDPTCKACIPPYRMECAQAMLSTIWDRSLRADRARLITRFSRSDPNPLPPTAELVPAHMPHPSCTDPAGVRCAAISSLLFSSRLGPLTVGVAPGLQHAGPPGPVAWAGAGDGSEPAVCAADGEPAVQPPG